MRKRKPTTSWFLLSLTLLLAGPALSLPSILVLKSVMGWKKTLTFTGLVIAMATLTGWAFGALV